MSWIGFVALALVSGALALVVGAHARDHALRRRFDAGRDAAASGVRPAAAPLTEAAIAHLPEPVRRYVALTGSLGRPMVTELRLRFDAAMYSAPGTPAMRGPVEQYERFDEPVRLFHMSTRMKGLPVSVLHAFTDGRATMQVRLAGLFDVVDLDGPELTRTETVTILNDLCFFAPSRLADPRLAWTAIDAERARVAFTHGRNTVSAELVFAGTGELVDFVSDDRARLEPDGSLRRLPWSTPLGDYRAFDGWWLASEGDALWHLPEGPFRYGHLRLTDYAAR